MKATTAAERPTTTADEHTTAERPTPSPPAPTATPSVAPTPTPAPAATSFTQPEIKILAENGVYTLEYLGEMLALAEKHQKAVPDRKARLSDYGREDCETLLRET